MVEIADRRRDFDCRRLDTIESAMLSSSVAFEFTREILIRVVEVCYSKNIVRVRVFTSKNFILQNLKHQFS